MATLCSVGDLSPRLCPRPQAAERLQIRGLVRVPADGESSSEEEEEEGGEEAEEARRIEHRQAAAAALASRAPWPAQRPDSPATAQSPPTGAQVNMKWCFMNRA